MLREDEDFPGLIPLISSYLNSVEVDADTHCTIHQYLRLIQKRADGELMTAARWIRHFVTSHPDYKYGVILFEVGLCLQFILIFRQDSVVSDTIQYDLLTAMDEIQEGTRDCPLLLDQPRSKSKATIPDAIQKAEKCTTIC